jgi:uncharacterized cupredoxin-like copper-binding protein
MIVRIIIAAAGLALAAAAAACGGGSEAATHITVGIHYSKFEPPEITVPAGVPVTFTIENGDPIGHEWIIGSPDVHARHRTGTEPYHDEIPTEVSIDAYETKVTTVTFEHPGTYLYICHLPGHEAYGMSGTLTVVEDDEFRAF